MQFLLDIQTKISTRAMITASALGLFPATASAQQADPATADTIAPPVGDIAPAVNPGAEAAAESAPAAETAGSYTPMAPEPGVGMPVDRGIDFQTQYSDIGAYAYWLNNSVLLPVITVISLLVLLLLVWVILRYRAKANPNPSKTSHNTLIEVIWTGVPALILIAIAFPSLGLLAKQYETAPADAVTVKVTGYQWYWGYSYPDNGDFEVVSNMLDEETAKANGEPYQLAVDNRMVVPVGEPIKVVITGADVIHSFAVPSLWFKMDAIPGRLNEKVMKINKPGVYYGQCSELCGARHGYMPIAVEALPREEWEQWVLAQGGTVGDDAVADAAPVDGEAPADEGAEEAVETALLTN
ncbi:MAG: cytochrome c oxidase subunit II [Pseudomonadota bacterium]